MADNIIKVVQFKGKTLVRRKDIELLFENAAEYKKRVPIEKAPITDFYTTAEVKEKYHVNESWIFVVAKKNNIPRTLRLQLIPQYSHNPANEGTSRLLSLCSESMPRVAVQCRSAGRCKWHTISFLYVAVR